MFISEVTKSANRSTRTPPKARSSAPVAQPVPSATTTTTNSATLTGLN
ncbi:unnamed protein product, partial [Nippostrongylus brasiliensis]|uniref:Uncharacterized protein n=1 Tax=Nippostrongylus brasiliensis TaxID=27835 RepID=A0A0N4XRS5_NIPBR